LLHCLCSCRTHCKTAAALHALEQTFPVK
jgi:hypothetical protein